MKYDTSPGLTFEGYVVPCCMVSGDAFAQIKKLLGDKVEQLHISSGTIDEINRSEAMYLFEKSFIENPIRQCIKICSSKIALDVNYQGCNTPFADIQKGKVQYKGDKE